MATASTSSVDPSKVALQSTVMCIREQIMEYFKGTCIERLTTNHNVQLVPLRRYMGRGEYQYIRQRMEREQACFVTVGGVPILTIKKSPSKIIFHEVSLKRSPQFRYIYKELEAFMELYLGAIEKEVNQDAIRYA